MFVIICVPLFLAVIFALTLKIPILANADQPKPFAAKQYKAPDGYFYFDEPTTITVNSHKLFVAEKNAIGVFTLNNFKDYTTTSQTSAPEKLAEYNGNYITLENNTIKIDGISIGGSYTDFSLYADSIFAISGLNIIEYKLNTAAPDVAAPTIIFSTSVKNKKIAASSNAIYLTQTSLNNSYYDDLLLYAKQPGGDWAVKANAESLNPIIELSASPLHNSVLSLDTIGIRQHSTFGTTLLQKNAISATNILTFSSNSDSIFALTRSKQIIKTNFDFKDWQKVLASESTDTGYYNQPSNTASRRGNIAIADEYNNRVIVYTPDRTVALGGLKMPKAIAIDNSGNYFVANNINQISKFTSDFIVDTAAKLTAPSEDIAIKDIKFNSNNDLYALSESGTLYKIAYGSKEFVVVPTPINQAILAFDISLDSDAVYIAINDTITVLDGQTILASQPNIASFCLDHDNSVYVLASSGSITKYMSGLSQSDLPQITGIRAGASSIKMNTTTDEKSGVKYGDLIVTDTTTHSVKTIDGEVLQVNKNFKTDSSAQLPFTDVPPTLNAEDKSRIIYSIKDNCPVYAGEAEIIQVANLNKNSSVIIMNFDSTKKFNFIIADNIVLGNDAPPIVGYIFTSYINSTAIEYTAQHPEFGYTYLPDVPIYAYPTRNSPKYSQYKTLAKNTKLKLLDFCFTADKDVIKYGYKDNYFASTTWYRVSFGENFVGYVTSDFISLRGANPDLNIYPQTNAVIISKDKNNSSVGAICYNKETDGTFTIRDDLEPIAVGTKIEVVGAFDSSSSHTLIKYLTTYGTIELYVDTLNIKYDGVNVVQIVAIILIIITLLLITVVILRVRQLKRARYKVETPDPTQEY